MRVHVHTHTQDILGWGENDRGVSYCFGRDVVQEFLQEHKLSLVCRAHQVVEDGYQFFQRRQVSGVIIDSHLVAELHFIEMTLATQSLPPN